MGGSHLNEPIVGMTATPDGKGYWLVAADGGIFSYGDAGFYGSTGGIRLNQPIVGMAATHDGEGYWLVAADGGIFNFGDAGFFGSAGGSNLPDAAVGMVASPDGGGYLIATENGVVLPYGDAQAFGGLSLDPTATQISAIIGNNQGTGYWLLDPEAWHLQLLHRHRRTDVPRFLDDRRRRGLPDRAGPRHPGPLLQPVRALRGVVRAVRHLGLGAGGHPDPVATPSWATSGTGLPRTASTSRRRQRPPWATPSCTGRVRRPPPPPCHVGIVTEVWPDGAIMSVGGDSGPGRDGYLSVALDGPFLPADSAWYNGVPIYGFSQP